MAIDECQNQIEQQVQILEQHSWSTKQSSKEINLVVLDSSGKTHSTSMKDSPPLHAMNEVLSNNFSSIESCISNIRNTHTFMLMTINRCIDYTKASKGIKLVPKYETIDFMETLQLPLNCMRNMQTRILIQSDNLILSNDICNFIITDKQWLQENLLCMLSNAVKYSAEGVVDIRITLKEYLTSRQTIEAIERSRDQEEEQDGSSYRRENGERDEENSARSLSEPRSEDAFNHLSFGRSPLANTDHKPTKELSSSMPKQLVPYLRIEVEDMGIGLSDEAMGSLFNPFKQTQRLAGGTGLGLYSLAKRIEALHGYYGVTKRRDGRQGSLFWFAIPYKPDPIYAQHMKRKSVIPDAAMIGFKDRDRDSSTQSSTAASPRSSRLFTPISMLSDPQLLAPSLSNADSGHQKSSTTMTTVNTTGTGDSTGAVLAAAVASAVKSESSTHAKNKINASPPSKPCLILLVDDSPAILKMSTLMLKRLGHTVITAENGAVAVKYIEDSLKALSNSTDNPEDGIRCGPQLFDVILMDLQMPVMDGLEATKRIRQLEDEIVGKFVHEEKRFRRHKIISMSANSDHETSMAALEAGADTFLSKPFNVESIRTLLDSD